jgi:hypothetical protein
MRASSIIRRGIAYFLLLVFFQQTGAGLFIHNLLHDKTPIGQSPVKKNETANEISFSCNCADNFLMPFVEGDEPTFLNRPYTHSKPVDAYTEQSYFTSLIFSALRGPPVFIG